MTMKDIDKSFVGVHALKNAQLELKRGEVHALMGENGAGKSTLMKILTGIYSKDSGTIVYDGKEVEQKSKRSTKCRRGDRASGIEYDEPPDRSPEYIYWPETMNGKLINDGKMVEEAKRLFDMLNIDIDPRETMGHLTVGKQQMCEIAKGNLYRCQDYRF